MSNIFLTNYLDEIALLLSEILDSPIPFEEKI